MGPPWWGWRSSCWGVMWGVPKLFYPKPLTPFPKNFVFCRGAKMHLAPFLDQQSVLEQKNGPLRYTSICICMKLISKIFLKICFTFSNKECGLPPESHRPTVPAAQRHRPPSPPTDCNYWIIIITASWLPSLFPPRQNPTMVGFCP